MKNKKSRFLVLMLSLIILVSNLPNTVYAETTSNVETTSITSQVESLEGNDISNDSDIVPFPVSQEISVEEYNRQVEELVSQYGNTETEILDKAGASYAASYDPRKTGKVTSVKDQGNYGLCWAYAAIATAESSMIAAGLANNTLDLSELHAAYFTFKNSRFTNFLEFCNNGWDPDDVFELMKNGVGPVNESLVPMPSTITANTTVDDTYRTQHLATLENIYATKVAINNKDKIKQNILNYGGVQLNYYSVGASTIYKENPDGSGDYSFYLPFDATRVNHAVEIVGWNDNYSKNNFAQTPAGNGAWLCKNSWGKTSYYLGSTGTGYFWISYYDETIQDVYGISVKFRENTINTSSITLDKTNIALEEGQTTQLSATVLPTNATNKKIVFESDNPYVATVDNSGIITATGFGKTIIRVKAEDGYSSASCEVNVYGSKFTLNVSELDLCSNASASNYSASIVPYLNGEDILSLFGREIEYTIEDETIAGLKRDGIYCSINGKKSGTTVLTASFKDDVYTNGETLTVKCLIRVTTKATAVMIENEISDIFIGDYFDLKTSVYPEYTSNKSVFYSSNDDRVAIVTDTGTVIGVGTGSTSITVKTADGNANKSFVINVHQQVEKITTKQESYTLEFGNGYYGSPVKNVYNVIYLENEVEVYPENAYDKNLLYYSLNESVAKVSSDGIIEPVGYGTATIRIQSMDEKGAYKDVTVHVKKHMIYEIYPFAVSVFTLDKTINPSYGKNMVPVSFGLNCNLFYSDIVNQYLTYSVSDTSIATIEKVEVNAGNGSNAGSVNLIVKAKKPGKTTITIQAKDDLKQSCSVVLEIKEDTSVGAVKTIDNAIYRIYNDKSVYLTKYIGTEKEVVVPEKVEIAGKMYKVMLDREAFENNTTITSVTMGEQIGSIPDSCFKGCTSLKSVEISSSATLIGHNAFYGCKNLKKVTIPGNVKDLGNKAFANCTSLKSISLSSKLSSISSGAFMNCTKLSKITIPSKVNKIFSKAFYNCKNLKTITIKSKKLKSNTVMSKAFKGIHKKATIKVPASKLKSYTEILKKRGVSGKKQKIKKL